MSSKSKAKGSSWERTIADHLSDLYGESFIRAPGSGAYVGRSNQSRKEFLHEGQIRIFKGDISPGPSFRKFNCEAKNYADFPFHMFFEGTVKPLEKWLEQLMEAADDGDFNVLCMKITRKATLVAVEAKHSSLVYNKAFLYSSPNYGQWYIMDYMEFWKLNKDLVKDLCK